MATHFAVMGNPVAHSLSPFIHQRFAEQTAIQLTYRKIQVTDTDFEFQVNSFFAEAGKGLNITLPFKERAYQMAIIQMPRCQQAKAANTLWVSEGRLYADNTDGTGLINDLRNYLDLVGKKVLILGAGGAARGIVGPLLTANIAQLTVANRTEEKLRQLIADFPAINYANLNNIQGNYDLIINATSASLTETNLYLPTSILRKDTLCYDLTYNIKINTPFVAWALAAGASAVDGLGMLVEQAAEAFFIWHGVKPTDTNAVITELRGVF